MLVEGIKSRPVHGGIKIDRFAKRHIFALEGEGALALLEQADELDGDIMGQCEVLYVAAGSTRRGYESRISELNPDMFRQSPTMETLLFRLRGSLSSATMSTRLYISGREGFIGQSMRVALELGMDFSSIPTEHRGSLARRVQCVHCKGITENVTFSPFNCSHCGLDLLVRDHYSRRLAAFQGVNIDAEEPGTAPRPEELFS